MKAEQLKSVVDNHKKYIDVLSRAKVTWTCQFVEDLLREELEYLKENEPRAFVSIDELEKAIRSVQDLWFSIEDMDTNELVKQNIWDRKASN